MLVVDSLSWHGWTWEAFMAGHELEVAVEKIHILGPNDSLEAGTLTFSEVTRDWDIDP